MGSDPRFADLIRERDEVCDVRGDRHSVPSDVHEHDRAPERIKHYLLKNRESVRRAIRLQRVRLYCATSQGENQNG